MLAIKKTIGAVLVGIPIFLLAVFTLIAAIELPPVRWVGGIVIVAALMMHFGIALLEKK